MEAPKTFMSTLPKLELYEDYGSNWEVYVEAIYEIFKQDFIYHTPNWARDNSQVGINSSPMEQGKEFTFWHITSEGNVEEERTPCFRRCERIRFPRHLIENFGQGRILAWEKEVKRGNKGREKRIHISPDDFSYLLVLSPAKNSKRRVITAFYVEREQQRENNKKDYQKFGLK